MDDRPNLDERAAGDADADLTPRPANDVEIELTPRELAMIEEAERSIATVGTIPRKQVWAWLDSLATDSPLPEPQPRKR